VAALVLLNATPGPSLAALTRSGEGPRYIDSLRSALQGGWPARMPGMQLLAPSLGRDLVFSAWVSQAFSEAGDHRRFLPAYGVALRADVRGLLARVRVPSLIVHRRDDAWFSTEHGRLLASLITGSRYPELPGADHPPYIGDAGAILRAVRWFVLDQLPSRRASDSPTRLQPLSPRQEEVLWLVREGLSDLEIADEMGLSPRAVQKHLEHAYRLLGVRNRTAAALRAPSLARRSGDGPSPRVGGAPILGRSGGHVGRAGP
jgi:DNA-binding CsgD family transcriptional regulator